MLSSDSTSSPSSRCECADALRDYAFDELPQDERRAMEQHLSACGACAMELDQLRLTTAALRILPDREIPQRIAFVSDKVFEPSATARWFSGFWNSASKLGFASACVLATGLIVSASLQYSRPAAVSGQVAASIDMTAQVRNQVQARSE